MFQNIKNQINSVRYGELEKRRKWFYIVTISLCLVFLVVGIIFIGSQLKSIEIGKEKNELGSNKGGISEFLDVFKSGIGVIKEKVKNSSRATEFLIDVNNATTSTSTEPVQ